MATFGWSILCDGTKVKASGFLEAGRFFSVGLVNTLVGLCVIYAAKWFFQIEDIAANLLGYCVGLLCSFSLNSRWTFSYRGPQVIALVKFLFLILIAYVSNLITVLAAIHFFKLNGYVAQATGIPPYTLIAFFGSKYIVFRSPK